MLQIPDSLIVNYSMSPQVYKQGMEYYRSGRIQSIRTLENRPVFYAVVRGKEDYQVRIVFDKNELFQSAECTCSFYTKNWGHCKHIVAVLLHLKRLKDKGSLSELTARRNSRQIFQYFEQVPVVQKQQVSLEPTFEFRPSYESAYGTSSLLSFKIGLGQMYVVRQVSRFLEQLRDGETIEFGKNFSYDPYWHQIPSQEGTILGFLQEIYEVSQMNDGLYNKRNNGLFHDKFVCLSDSLIKRFFYLMREQTFHAVLPDKDVPKMQIRRERIPTSFLIQMEDDSLTCKVQTEDAVYSITSDQTYILAGDQIYAPPTEHIRRLAPFLQLMGQSSTQKLIFYGRDRERFVSEVLPHVRQAGKVSIDDKLGSMLVKEPLHAEIYFDRDGNGIQIRVQFQYGKQVLDPFDPRHHEKEDEVGILVRDMESERRILELFEQYAFLVQPNRIYLEEEEKIFDFFHTGLFRLMDIATVFYSDDFKVSIRDKAISSAGIRLNDDTSLLEFSFDTADIDPMELTKVLSALREKKRYYRLKDGSFLSLESKDLHEMAQIVDDLGIKDIELEKGLVSLPKYRALYMDRQLRELVDGVPAYQPGFQQLLNDVQNPENVKAEVPSSLTNILRDYQRTGFLWLKTLSFYGLGGILADDMGLGKTLQVLTLLLSEKGKGSKKPSLVVAPTSLIYNWDDEVQKFVPELSIVIVTGTKEERKKSIDEISNVDLVITSYPLIRRDKDEYKEYSFKYCIIDEAQHIKNPKSQSAKAVKSIRAEHRFALTGTPIENSLTELWSIFDFVMPGFLFSHAKFIDAYEKPIVRNQDKKAAEKLAAYIRPFVLRRLKTDVLTELPEKIENKMMTELTEEQKNIYLAYLTRVKGEIAAEIDRSGYEKSHIKILAAITRLRQICCHPGIFLEEYKGESGKLLQLEEIIPDALTGGHRILLFSQFTSMLKLIQQHMEKLRIPLFYLDGSTAAQDRNLMVKRFNEGEGKVFLISLKAGGTGLNLTGADMVIHYDPWWNPAVEEQASDRAYRIGQKKVVHVMRLITRGTIEEKIEKLKEKKRFLADAVIRPGETLVSKLSREEIMALFD